MWLAGWEQRERKVFRLLPEPQATVGAVGAAQKVCMEAMVVSVSPVVVREWLLMALFLVPLVGVDIGSMAAAEGPVMSPLTVSVILVGFPVVAVPVVVPGLISAVPVAVGQTA